MTETLEQMLVRLGRDGFSIIKFTPLYLPYGWKCRLVGGEYGRSEDGEGRKPITALRRAEKEWRKRHG